MPSLLSNKKPATSAGFLLGENQGRVATSSEVRKRSACSWESPHISLFGCRLEHTAGRSARPKMRQRPLSFSCTHGTPAGLPLGIPGRGEEMDGAMQQAAQPERQFINTNKYR